MSSLGTETWLDEYFFFLLVKFLQMDSAMMSSGETDHMIPIVEFYLLRRRPYSSVKFTVASRWN